jgi:hypothetical protein
MKKLIILLSIIVLSSCSCLIGQIPPVSLFVDESCGAAMPDLRPMLRWQDNCGIDTVEQTPTPGSWLTEKYNTVHFRAYDNFRNFTDVLGSVELLDTTPPELVGVDSTLITQVYKNVTSLYNAADRLLALNEMWFDDTFPWDDVEFQYVDSLGVAQTLRGIPEELRPTNLYCNYTMVTTTPACYAFLGEGARYTVFVKPGTTFTIPE